MAPDPLVTRILSRPQPTLGKAWRDLLLALCWLVGATFGRGR